MQCLWGWRSWGRRQALIGNSFINSRSVLFTPWEKRPITHLGHSKSGAVEEAIPIEDGENSGDANISSYPTWAAPQPIPSSLRALRLDTSLLCTPSLSPTPILQSSVRVAITCCLVTQGLCGRGCPWEGRSPAGCSPVSPSEQGDLSPSFGPEPPPGLPTSWAGTGPARSGSL